MPTLNWIGKDKVINHHTEVPFRVLEHKYGYRGDNPSDTSETHSGNKIIHGDNLEALKALLPEYEGKIDCVYIDPPYNTGNEGWVYNDNVNDPHIRKWLGEVVGAEGEDLSRHDKWLCMMYPRLRLLHKLLSAKGVIFISIDDNEQANLKIVCDEIFGLTSFVADIAWQRTYSMRNDSLGIPAEKEHILVYSKDKCWQPNKLSRTAEMDAKYKNPDNDKSPWQSVIPHAPGAVTHQGMVYAIQNPFTGEMIYPRTGRCWTFGQEQMLDIMCGWCPYILKDIHDDKQRAIICGVTEKERLLAI
jgi:adenine-specific DNA-methyltransferase